MKIITYNVNGLRAAVSKGLPEWLEQEQADVAVSYTHLTLPTIRLV